VRSKKNPLVAGVEIVGYVKRIQDLEGVVDPNTVTLDQVESNIVRCPDSECAEQMIERIEQVGAGFYRWRGGMRRPQGLKGWVLQCSINWKRISLRV